MKETSSTSRSHERWAHFRFSVIGPLLAAPASRGELQGQLQQLAAKKWRHPISGELVLFGLSAIERWDYKALHSKAGQVEALKRKIRSDHGQHPSLTPRLIELLPMLFSTTSRREYGPKSPISFQQLGLESSSGRNEEGLCGCFTLQASD